MRSVKGTIFIPWVKTIRADKSGLYDARLTADDRTIIESKVMPFSWYPFETYRNCLNAVTYVTARGDAETVREWGRVGSRETMTTVYKTAIKKGDPGGSMAQFALVFRSMFNFGEMSSTIPRPNEASITIADFEADFEMFYHLTRGWLECFLGLCTDKTVESRFAQRVWSGDPQTQIIASW